MLLYKSKFGCGDFSPRFAVKPYGLYSPPPPREEAMIAMMNVAAMINNPRARKLKAVPVLVVTVFIVFRMLLDNPVVGIEDWMLPKTTSPIISVTAAITTVRMTLTRFVCPPPSSNLVEPQFHIKLKLHDKGNHGIRR